VFNSPGGSFAPPSAPSGAGLSSQADSARPGGLPWRGATDGQGADRCESRRHADG